MALPVRSRDGLVLALLSGVQLIVLLLAQVVVVAAQVVAYAHDRHHARAVARDAWVDATRDAIPNPHLLPCETLIPSVGLHLQRLYGDHCADLPVLAVVAALDALIELEPSRHGTALELSVHAGLLREHRPACLVGALGVSSQGKGSSLSSGKFCNRL